jgi:hypothetical protein
VLGRPLARRLPREPASFVVGGRLRIARGSIHARILVTQSFGPHPLKVAFAFVLTALFGWAFLDDYQMLRHNRHEVLIEGLLAFAAAVSLVWLLSLKLTIADDAVTYRSIFGIVSMRHDRIREIFFVRDRRKAFSVLPLWEASRTVLVSTSGDRLVFGSRLRSAGFAGDKIMMINAQRLYNLAATRFNRGHEVAFGPVRISRKGLWTDGWKSGTYPWTQVRGVESSFGGFFVNLTDGVAVGGRGLAHIPNVLVLSQIIQTAVALGTSGADLVLPIAGDDESPPPSNRAPRP